jgi:hypothetical protein
MNEKLLGTLEPDEFDDLINAFINRSEPDTMSFAAFDQAVGRLAQEAIVETIELTGTVQDNAIVFDSAGVAPVAAQGNQIFVGGLRLVVRLRQPEAA